MPYLPPSFQPIQRNMALGVPNRYGGAVNQALPQQNQANFQNAQRGIPAFGSNQASFQQAQRGIPAFGAKQGVQPLPAGGLQYQAAPNHANFLPQAPEGFGQLQRPLQQNQANLQNFVNRQPTNYTGALNGLLSNQPNPNQFAARPNVAPMEQNQMNMQQQYRPNIQPQQQAVPAQRGIPAFGGFGGLPRGY